jgi:hypothetical protein
VGVRRAHAGAQTHLDQGIRNENTTQEEDGGNDNDNDNYSYLARSRVVLSRMYQVFSLSDGIQSPRQNITTATTTMHILTHHTASYQLITSPFFIPVDKRSVPRSKSTAEAHRPAQD